MYSSTGMIVLKRLPSGLAVPSPTCYQAKHLLVTNFKGALHLGCWQKQNFIGRAALQLKRSVLGSLRPSTFVRYFSRPIVKSLNTILNHTAIHLRLEADAVAGGISRKINHREVLHLLAQEHFLPKTTVLYLAVGGFENKQSVLDEWRNNFVLRTKEDFWPAINEVIPEREVRAAIEFDVLRSSQVFFGHSCSSMSTILTQVRCFTKPGKKHITYYYDEHNTKGSKPKCEECIWNGRSAVRMSEKSWRPYSYIGHLKGSGLRKVPCVPRSKI